MQYAVKKGLAILSAAALWLSLVASGYASLPGLTGTQSVTLGWTASSDPTVVGYYLYISSGSGVITNRITAGTQTELTIGGLVAGQTYNVWSTSFNGSGMESIPTPTISYLAPGMLALSQSAANGAMNISFPVAAGYNYELQASSDLNSWSNIWVFSSESTNAWVEFDDPFTSAVVGRFYRLLSN